MSSELKPCKLCGNIASHLDENSVYCSEINCVMSTTAFSYEEWQKLNARPDDALRERNKELEKALQESLNISVPVEQMWNHELLADIIHKYCDIARKALTGKDQKE